ncbi:hypothetical protein GCM10009557_69350 [Virgisporangium ochraceum]
MRRQERSARRVGGLAACGPVAVVSGRTEELVVGAGSLVVKQHPQPVPRATLLLADRRRDIYVPALAASVLGGRSARTSPRVSRRPRR